MSNLSAVLAPNVVVMTTSGATSYDKFDIMIDDYAFIGGITSLA